MGKPGREILFFLVFFWFGAAAPRVLVLSLTPPQRSLYIPQTDFRGQVQPWQFRQPAATANEQTNIYIYIDSSFFMQLYLVEIYMRTERIKTFKNTPCATYRRTCATYLVSSISCISILMLHISISTVTGLISKKTSGTSRLSRHNDLCKLWLRSTMVKNVGYCIVVVAIGSHELGRMTGQCRKPGQRLLNPLRQSTVLAMLICLADHRKQSST